MSACVSHETRKAMRRTSQLHEGEPYIVGSVGCPRREKPHLSSIQTRRVDLAFCRHVAVVVKNPKQPDVGEVLEAFEGMRGVQAGEDYFELCCAGGADASLARGSILLNKACLEGPDRLPSERARPP